MPRYYFHLRSTSGLELDFDGAEFESVRDARAEAAKAAREIIAERVWSGEVLTGETFEISTAEGTIVATVPFKMAARLE